MSRYRSCIYTNIEIGDVTSPQKIYIDKKPTENSSPIKCLRKSCKIVFSVSYFAFTHVCLFFFLILSHCKNTTINIFKIILVSWGIEFFFFKIILASLPIRTCDQDTRVLGMNTINLQDVVFHRCYYIYFPICAFNIQNNLE